MSSGAGRVQGHSTVVVCSDGIAAMVHRKRVRNEGVVAEMHAIATETVQRCYM